MEENIFIIFNTSKFSDIIVTNTLVQNIKLYFPESKVVFVCNSEFADAARYQAGVNEIIVFDKQKNNSIKSIIKFVKNFPYKKPFASFVINSETINLIISRLIGARHIISNQRFNLLNTSEKYEMRNYSHIKDIYAGMIEPLTNAHKNLPIKFIPPEINNELIQAIKNLNKPVILSLTSNSSNRNMPVNDCKELIHLLQINGYTPVLTGSGDVARQYVVDLKESGCIDFIDIVDCTSIIEFANILKICNNCISIDTVSLHLANALNVPAVGIFYNGLAYMRGSDTNLYPAKIIDCENQDMITPQYIVKEFKELTGVCL